ncbi:MAG TPA: PEGA domain-containing protein [Candidatus Saccharimonadales bacterium]|nr:PEGA domain-containing protein [Candidatus Saccharimonadales bacterium]
MDFLDPKKQKAHNVRLIVGYVLIGIALALTTVILLYKAYGFDFDRQGRVIQNGLVFMSSTPNPAQVYINGEKYKNDTNVRISLASGQYTFELRKAGYLPWKRAITVEGGSVRRFDYPFLIPSDLKTSSLRDYATVPRVLTQSPDRRWLLTQNGDATTRFVVFDLNNPKDAPKDIVLPDNAATVGDDGSEVKWETVQWSSDNRHVILKHGYQKGGTAAYEYILLDRQDPAESKNLTQAWGINPTSLQMQDRSYDKYYLYDAGTKVLSTATLKDPQPKEYAKEVLGFKSYGDNIVVYATTKGQKSGEAAVMWQDGDKKYTIKTFAADVTANATFLVDITKYDGDWYVAAGSSVEGKVYVYRNPLQMLSEDNITVPVHILKVTGINYIEFSNNARFIMGENGSKFSVYDAEYDKGYAFDVKKTLDSPQAHASWMDGHRLLYVSGGKVEITDFDNANQATLVADNPAIVPVFDRDYNYMYTITGRDNTTTPFALDKTALRIPADL